MKEIILLEGLPGSGKTTFARRLSEYLSNHNVPNIFYNEGDLHPVDLAWIAILSKEEFKDAINKYPSLKEDIFKHAFLQDNRYFLPYTKVQTTQETQDFYEYMSHYEIYQEDKLTKFFEEHKKRWLHFIEERKHNEFTYIFECVFLQNHINELMLKNDFTDKEILAYFLRFSDLLKGVKVRLFYINQLDVKARLDEIIEQRRSSNKELYPDWIDQVIDYLALGKYAKAKGYIGYNGAMKFFSDRKKLENMIVEHLPFETKTIDLGDDYDSVFDQIIKSID